MYMCVCVYFFFFFGMTQALTIRKALSPKLVQMIFQMQMGLLDLHTKIFSASAASYHFPKEHQHAIKIEGF